ncbi:MAG: putative quinol monooxygenase [Actinomycetota bacterium]|jgi:quinol monooxygenase YgiN
MSKVAVAVKLRIKAGQRDAFTEAVKPGLVTAQGESGTQTYIFHHDALDADVVWFYEMYADQDAFQAHMGSDAFKAFSKSLGEFIDGAPEFNMLTPIGGKGL